MILQFFSLRGQNFHTKSGHENIPSIIHDSDGDLRVIVPLVKLFACDDVSSE